MTQAIQGRKVGPDDLPAFCSTLIGEIAAGRSSR